MAIDNNTIVVGAPKDDEKGTNAGAVYVFAHLNDTQARDSGSVYIFTIERVIWGHPYRDQGEDTWTLSKKISGTREEAHFGDFETRSQYRIRVQADDGQCACSFTRSLTISITDRTVEDTDGDGLSNHDELVYLGTSPRD